MLLLIHCLSCFCMTGVIWIVQLVHYPSFLWVDEKKFCQFSEFHQKNISFVVIPLMLTELISCYFLWQENNIPVHANYINTIALILIWLVTFFVSVPLHQKLSIAYNHEAISSLIKTNWARTILWTLRTALLFSLLMFTQ